MLTVDKEVYSLDDRLSVSPRPPESVIAVAYLEMIRDGTMQSLFYESKPELSWFLQWCAQPGATTLACWARIDQDVKLAGIGRIGVPMPVGSSDKRKAEISVAFLLPFQKRHYSLQLAELMIMWVRDHLELHSVWGTTPDRNRAMRMFLSALGFQYAHVPEFTTWKGDICGAWLSWLKLEDWAPRFLPTEGTSVRSEGVTDGGSEFCTADKHG